MCRQTKKLWLHIRAIPAETGVPWDVALMADVMLANQQDMRIEDMESSVHIPAVLYSYSE